jgi:hypothetical protein
MTIGSIFKILQGFVGGWDDDLRRGDQFWLGGWGESVCLLAAS